MLVAAGWMSANRLKLNTDKTGVALDWVNTLCMLNKDRVSATERIPRCDKITVVS